MTYIHINSGDNFIEIFIATMKDFGHVDYMVFINSDFSYIIKKDFDLIDDESSEYNGDHGGYTYEYYSSWTKCEDKKAIKCVLEGTL